MVATDINLLKAKTATFPLGIYEEKLRRIALIALASLFVAGLLVGSSFLYLSSRVRALESDKAQLTTRVRALSAVEGLILSLKKRSAIAGKVLSAVRPWGGVFGLLDSIAPPGFISTLTVDERGRVMSYLELPTIDEAVKVVAATTRLYDEQKIRSPQLVNLSLREDGAVQLGVSFVPVW